MKSIIINIMNFTLVKIFEIILNDYMKNSDNFKVFLIKIIRN